MLALANMSGVAPKLTPELLQDQLAQTALNVRLHNGGVASLREPVTIATPTKAGPCNTIYRFGKNAGESQYWFKWSTAVSICRGPIAGDTEERTYFTGSGTPKKTKFDLATQSGTDYPMASYELGIPAPTAAPTLTAVGGVGPTVAETRAYIYTNVSAWGEESSPSPPALGDVNASTLLQLSGFSAVPLGQYNIVSRRIYRSVAASSGTNYYLVKEIPVATASVVDDTAVAAIGEPIPTLDWDVPPDDLAGLVALPSGALCGFSGKEVCFSVVGAPYAWPQKYRLTADYNIVAVSPMGQGVVVLTDGYPYLINTGDPEGAQMVRLDEEQACVSARSVVSFSGGVIYASPDGLVMVTSGGVKLITADIYDNEKWRALSPENIFSAKHDGRYYGFLASGGFIFDLAGHFTFHNVTATAAYVDPVLDRLYVAVGQNVQRWDAGANKTHTWKSKRWNLGTLTSFAVAQIKANSFADLMFNLYIDGALAYSTPVVGPDPFKLPSFGRARLFEVEITGTDHWTACAVAHSVEELKNV